MSLGAGSQPCFQSKLLCTFSLSLALSLCLSLSHTPLPCSSTPSPSACQELGTVKLISSGNGKADSLMGALGCNVAPSLSALRFWAKLIRAGLNRASLWFQTQTGRWTETGCSAKARRSGGARRNRGSMGAARHTPTVEHAPKACAHTLGSFSTLSS